MHGPLNPSGSQAVGAISSHPFLTLLPLTLTVFIGFLTIGIRVSICVVSRHSSACNRKRMEALLGKYWDTEPMLTPAFSAKRAASTAESVA